MVSLVAMLVWLYAESENVKPHDLEVQVRFVAAAGRNLLIHADKPTLSVKLKVRCNTAQLSQLEQLIAKGPFPIPLTQDPAAPDDQQQILLKQRLASLPLIANLGVTVTEARPPQIAVTVRRLEQMKLNINATADGDTQLQDVVIEPAEALIHLPSDQLASLSQSDLLIAHLSAAVLEPLELNQTHTIENVPLLAPLSVRSDDARIDPVTATVTFTITKQTREAVISSVAVRMVMPAAAAQQYDVTLLNEQDQLLRGLKIVGPHDLVDQITQRQIKIWADLRLDADELAKGVGKESISVVPHIQKPDKVKIVEPPQPIKLRITVR